MRKRLHTREQLERKYANDIRDCYCTDYFEFIVHCAEMSSNPKEAFADWYCELNKAGRKEFCSFLVLNNACRQLIHWAIELL